MRMSKKIIAGAFSVALIATTLAGCSEKKSESVDTIKSATAASAPAATPAATTDVAKPAADAAQLTADAAKPAPTTTVTSIEQTGTSLIDNVSYTLGYSVASNVSAQLKAQGAALDNPQILAGFKAGISNENGKFTQEQMQSIMQDFQRNLMAAQEKKQISLVLANTTALLSNEQTPTVGPKDAQVAVIEFFDYQCVFCHKIAPIMEKVMSANPNIKYIFKEFPIFGQRWQASQYAAEMGIAAYMLNGAEGYLKYHNAIFASGVDEGKLTVTDVNDAAKKVGIDVAKAESLIKEKKVTDNIAADMKLGFDKLGIQGTPAIIVMPLSDATAENTTVIPGFAPQETIQAAINKAQGK